VGFRVLRAPPYWPPFHTPHDTTFPPHETTITHTHTHTTGILGENLVLPSLWTADLRGFIVINLGTLSFCIATFFLGWRVMVAKKLI
jgi:hypothetical protein